MSLQVLPLPAILFQSFFLTIAIAIESSILHNHCNFSRKMSIEYAATINLMTAISGWLFFFYYVNWFLPDSIKIKLIAYIFLNGLATDTKALLFTLAFITFWVTYGIKLVSVNFLNKLCHPFYPLKEEKDEDEMNEQSGRTFVKRKTKKYPERREAMALLWGHAYSHSAFLLILWLKDWQFFQ